MVSLLISRRGHFAPKRVGVRGRRVNFHPNRSIRGVKFNPNRSIKFSQKWPKTVGKYENFTNDTQREWLKTKNHTQQDNRSMFDIWVPNQRVCGVPEVKKGGLMGGTSLLTLTEGLPVESGVHLHSTSTLNSKTHISSPTMSMRLPSGDYVPIEVFTELQYVLQLP